MDSVQIMVEKESADMEPKARKKRGISGSTVKIIAVIFMLIDHAAAVILARQMMVTGYMEAFESGLLEEMMGWLTDNTLLYYSYDLMRLMGRMAFPIFCFLMVEGFQKTGDVKKYLARLGIFAIVSEIPFDLAICGKWFALGHQNVFFTLFLGLFTLCCMEYFATNQLPKVWRIILDGTGTLLPAAYITICLANIASMERIGSMLIACGILCIAISLAYLAYGKMRGKERAEALSADITVLMLVMYLADLLYTDYSGMGVLTIVVIYLFRKRHRVLAMAMGCLVLCLMSLSEITAFFALIPIALYNGEKGMKMKYFFYAFYPVHLLVLYLICVVMGMGGVTLPM